MTDIVLGLGDNAEIVEPHNGRRIWSDYDAVAACEGFDGIEHDQETLVSAWQHLIDTGMAWTLQGWFGRQATAMIEHGLCTPRKAKP